VWPVRRADNSAVLVVPNVKLRMKVRHSIPPLSLHDLLRESFTFYIPSCKDWPKARFSSHWSVLWSHNFSFCLNFWRYVCCVTVCDVCRKSFEMQSREHVQLVSQHVEFPLLCFSTFRVLLAFAISTDGCSKRFLHESILLWRRSLWKAIRPATVCKDFLREPPNSVKCGGIFEYRKSLYLLKKDFPVSGSQIEHNKQVSCGSMYKYRHWQ
jgi:hypothetical protein